MFFQGWELLVLTKLGWNLELVTACDYLPPLLSLLAERGGEEEEEEEDAKSSLVTNGELVSIELVDIWSGGGNTEREVTVGGGGGRGGDSFAALCQEM